MTLLHVGGRESGCSGVWCPPARSPSCDAQGMTKITPFFAHFSHKIHAKNSTARSRFSSSLFLNENPVEITLHILMKTNSVARGEGKTSSGRHCASRPEAPPPSLLAAYSLPRGRRGRRRAGATALAVTEAPPRKASIRPTKPRPLPPAPIPPPPCSLLPSPPREGRREAPVGTPQFPSGRRRTPRAPLFPSHSGHSSDRWSSDPGDAPRA
mgnify:CR=1 FL=1